VDCVGYLVPAADFDGTVHSVFARASNIARDDALFTVVSHDLSDGPTTLRLGRGAPVDLRALFRPGDRLRCRDGVACAPGVALRLTGAATWRPAPLQAAVSTRQIDTNLRFAAAALARARRSHSSVIDRKGSETVAGLGRACRDLDVGCAALEVERLIGWGEGLTPAGDDVLVGLRAALGAQVGGREDRVQFLVDLSAAMIAQAHRTTPVAAHYLRLAARGHFNADVARLVDALLGARGTMDLAPALLAALDNGATSGADTVTGMIAGLAAWLGAGPGDDAGDIPPGRSAVTSPMQ